MKMWENLSFVSVHPYFCLLVFGILVTLVAWFFPLFFLSCPSKCKQRLQVNLCQKLLFLHQLTHNMMTDCSLNYKFNTWKFQAQTWGGHVVYRNCFWHSDQFLYTTCSPYVLQKEELLTKIYLYYVQCSVRILKLQVPSSNLPSWFE